MGVQTRVTLPEEFYDITSAKLLIQPEPEYFHAKLFKSAMAGELGIGMMGLAPGRTIPDQGADYPANEGRLMLEDGILSNAVAMVADLTGQHTVRLNRPKFTNTTYTQAVREVPSGSTISVVPVEIQSEQVAITVKRFAGPYDATNSRVAPYCVDEFDAKRSVHSLAKAYGANLRRDYDRTVDAFLVTLFDVVTNANVIRPSGMTSDNSSTVAGDFPMDLDTIYRAEETLDSANVPTFPNGRRPCVLSPRQCRQLKSDPDFAKQVEFHRDISPMFNSYIGSIGKVDFFKSTTLTTASNSSSVAIHYGQMFGPGKVGAGLGGMPRVLSASDDNYGLHAKIIWEHQFGLVNLDDRFGISLRSS